MPLVDLQRHRDGLLHVSGRWLIAASVIVAIGLCALGASVLTDMRNSDYEQARVAGANVVATIEADIARNIELYDLSMQAVVDGFKHPEIHKVSREFRQLVLFDRSATAKHLGRIRIIDETGRLLVDSRAVDFPGTNLSNRDYFRAHERNPDVGLYIGRPAVTPGGHYIIGISRRLSHPDGSFAGVVSGTLRLSFFHDLFRNVTLQPGSSLTLTRSDGTVLMRAPFNIDDIGRDLSVTEVFKRAGTARAGHFEATAGIDGFRRLYVFKRVTDLPLLMTIGISTDEIYSGWHRQAWSIGLVILILALATIALALFSAGELRRRNSAENALAVLATTDGLTGLANRRAFDAALQREWKRSLRQGTPLALLMIDADHFKAYNDSLGHQAGDKALAAIAACIGSGRRDGTDFTARYGGEEFAVLLPGASPQDAFRVAERIRAAVESLSASDSDISHFPTVSIGIAGRIPTDHAGHAALVAAADHALYEAKRNGRNRSEAEPVEGALKLVA